MTDLAVSARLTLDNKGYVSAIQQAEGETRRFAQGAAALSGKVTPLDAAGVDAATRALEKSNQELALTVRNALVLERAEAQLNAQLARGQISQAQHADALRRVHGELSSTRDAANAAAGASNGLGNAVQSVGRYALGLVALSAVRQYAGQALAAAEGYQKLQAQLRLVTENNTQYAVAQEAVLKIARETGASLAETAQLYARLAPPMREAGYVQKDVADMAGLVAKALRLSGASTAESSAAMLQFSQAMSSGVLRGDEFNSMAEAAPILMRKMADGMEVPVGALRKMAEAGELTADRVAAALLKSREAIERDFEKMPKTVSMAWQNLSNEVTVSIGQFNEATGTTAMLAQGINLLTGNLNAAVAVIAGLAAGAAIVAVFTPMGLAITAAATAAGALVAALVWLNRGAQARYAEQEKALKQQEEELKVQKEINAARLKMREISAPPGYEEALVHINQALREGRIDSREAGAAMNAYVEAATAGAKKLEKIKANFAAFLPSADKVRQALAELDAEYKTAQENGIANEAAYQARRTKIITDVYKDQIKLYDDLLKEATSRELSETEQKIAALLATEKQRITAAQGNEALIQAARAATTAGVKALMRDETAATKKSAEDRLKEIRDNLAKATAEETNYANTVKTLQADLAGKRASWAEADRERARAAMSDASAQLDLAQEVDEKLAAAADARRAGDEESAKALAEQSLKLAGNITATNERSEAERRARAVIEASYQAQIGRSVELGRAATARKEEFVAAEKAQLQELDSITRRLGELDAALKNPRSLDISTTEVMQKLDAVQRRIEEINAASMQAGSASSAGSSDGLDTIFTPSTGTILRRADGGRIYGPGTPTSDSILLRGSVDEYMVRAASARRIGYGVMDYINRYGELPPGHATGGRIGQPAPALPAGFTAASAAESAGGGNTYHIAQVVLPDVRDFDGFVRQLEDRSRTQPLRINTVAAGRRAG